MAHHNLQYHILNEKYLIEKAELQKDIVELSSTVHHLSAEA